MVGVITVRAVNQAEHKLNNEDRYSCLQYNMDHPRRDVIGAPHRSAATDSVAPPPKLRVIQKRTHGQQN